MVLKKELPCPGEFNGAKHKGKFSNAKSIAYRLQEAFQSEALNVLKLCSIALKSF